MPRNQAPEQEKISEVSDKDFTNAVRTILDTPPTKPPNANATIAELTRKFRLVRRVKSSP